MEDYFRFVEGDEVICIKEYDGNDSIVGKLGKVTRCNGDLVTVCFYDYVNGHAGGGHGPNGYYWNFYGESGTNSIRLTKERVYIPIDECFLPYRNRDLILRFGSEIEIYVIKQKI